MIANPALPHAPNSHNPPFNLPELVAMDMDAWVRGTTLDAQKPKPLPAVPVPEPDAAPPAAAPRARGSTGLFDEFKWGRAKQPPAAAAASADSEEREGEARAPSPLPSPRKVRGQ